MLTEFISMFNADFDNSIRVGYSFRGENQKELFLEEQETLAWLFQTS